MEKWDILLFTMLYIISDKLLVGNVIKNQSFTFIGKSPLCLYIKYNFSQIFIFFFLGPCHFEPKEIDSIESFLG